jgi:uncharacterized lipoprotein YmbA
MKKERKSFIAVLIVFASLMGCGGTAPTRFYTLTSIEPPGIEGRQTPPDKTVCLAVSMIEIPDYLDRPYIMTRDGHNGMDYSEFDRWAGSLREDVVRVLAENLSARLENVTVLTDKRAHPVDYRMRVNIRRLDPIQDERVQLRAVWSVLSKDGKELLIRQESNLSQPIEGRDYPAVVLAMSHVLGALSDEMTARLRTVVNGGAGSK